MLEKADALLKEHLAIIFDSIADGVFTVDKNWLVTSINRAAEEIIGISGDEAVGRPCCEIFRSSICEANCALKETLLTGRPVINKTIYIVDVEGRQIPISISTAILRDSNGNTIGGVETFRDLSVVEQLRKELFDKYTFADIIGRSKAMRDVFDLLPLLAGSDSTVLIEGASGTGKEIVARAIHDLSPRREHPFVAINCGALPDSLLESELFGYKAGAFTDARTDKPGRFAVADGGTMLLDEIGDISPAMQTRLLRVLQERTYEPLGSVKPVKFNVRVIAATNKSLDTLVRKGTFRKDLFYRVNVVNLKLPRLKDRREDIPLLTEHFIAKCNSIQNKKIDGISDESLAILMRHDYPGNVRELENVIEHAFVLCRGSVIESSHLPSQLADGKPGAVSLVREGSTLLDMEAIHIIDALSRHAGNRTSAARELGIDSSTLYRKIKRLDLDPPLRDGRFRDRK
jgi:PAS domain S-box-containing protein